MKAKRKSEIRPASPTGPGHRSAMSLPQSGEGAIPVGELYLDPEAVGKRLKLSPRTVADMANEGRLPAYRIGIALRFKWKDVDDYITANCKVRAGLATTAVAARHALPTNGGAQ